MIRIKGLYSQNEIKLMEEYCQFILTKFVSPSKLENSIIRVNFITEKSLPEEDREEFRTYAAWMYDSGKNKNDKRVFEIFLNKSGINKRTKTKVVKFKALMKDLAHELVHVKQYLNHELFDYKDGSVRFKGVKYSFHNETISKKDDLKADWDYFDSPYEIEAYGRTDGLYTMFKKQLKLEGRL